MANGERKNTKVLSIDGGGFGGSFRRSFWARCRGGWGRSADPAWAGSAHAFGGPSNRWAGADLKVRATFQIRAVRIEIAPDKTKWYVGIIMKAPGRLWVCQTF